MHFKVRCGPPPYVTQQFFFFFLPSRGLGHMEMLAEPRVQRHTSLHDDIILQCDIWSDASSQTPELNLTLETAVESINKHIRLEVFHGLTMELLISIDWTNSVCFPKVLLRKPDGPKQDVLTFFSLCSENEGSIDGGFV